MPDSKQLPSILKLLDDNSEVVRKIAEDALTAFGPSLIQHLAQLANPPDKKQMEKIQNLVTGRSNHASSSQELILPEALFQPGQLVRHKRYHYRGVVVAIDPTCQADDGWYLSNKTQPERSQPWYHVLVHDSDHTTYAAQTSLEEDPTGEEIHHPMIQHFFTCFKNGQYIRNERLWPDP